MADCQIVELASENLSIACKVSGLSQVCGVKKRTLRRYDRIGLLHPASSSDSGHHLYTRDDLIQLERLAVMQMLGLSRSQIKDCLNSHPRDTPEELRLQRKILHEKRKRLNHAIYFIEYAEMVNRDPQSGDWHYLGKVVEAIKILTDPEYFKRLYIQGNIHGNSQEMLSET